jgi:hypothetical protein
MLTDIKNKEALDSMLEHASYVIMAYEGPKAFKNKTLHAALVLVAEAFQMMLAIYDAERDVAEVEKAIKDLDKLSKDTPVN